MISDVYFPRVNGVSTSIQTFRRDLARLGCESWLIAPTYPAARDDEPNVLRQPSRYVPFDPEDRFMSAGAVQRACLALRGRVDLVHVHTPFVAHVAGMRVARAMNVPVIETYHTFFEEYLHHYLPLLPRFATRAAARAISRRQCNAVDAVIAPSRQLADVLRVYGVTTPVDVVPTGLDLGGFAGGDGSRFRERFGIADGRPVMLLVSRVAHEKNIGFLLDVLGVVRQSVPEVLFVIAGEGPALKALERKVVETGAGENALFVGYLDRGTELLDCYRAANVFVFASRTETQGLVLLEAMALGTPVVSTAVLGTREVLDGAAGAVVATEDKFEFAREVIDVLRSPERQTVLGVEGRKFVATHWSSAAMARRVLAVYERLSGAR